MDGRAVAEYEGCHPVPVPDRVGDGVGDGTGVREDRHVPQIQLCDDGIDVRSEVLQVAARRRRVAAGLSPEAHGHGPKGREGLDHRAVVLGAVRQPRAQEQRAAADRACEVVEPDTPVVHVAALHRHPFLLRSR